MKLRTLFTLIGLFIGTAELAHARPPMPRSVKGSIVEVDSRLNLVTVRTEENNHLQLLWIRRTRFLRSNQFSDATVLQAGATAEFRYRTPFFGSRWLTKVVADEGQIKNRSCCAVTKQCD